MKFSNQTYFFPVENVTATFTCFWGLKDMRRFRDQKTLFLFASETSCCSCENIKNTEVKNVSKSDNLDIHTN